MWHTQHMMPQHGYLLIKEVKKIECRFESYTRNKDTYIPSGFIQEPMHKGKYCNSYCHTTRAYSLLCGGAVYGIVNPPPHAFEKSTYIPTSKSPCYRIDKALLLARTSIALLSKNYYFNEVVSF